MPCNSDHMEPDGLEVEGSRVLALMDELDGETLNEKHYGGMHPSVYNRGVTKRQVDSWTAQLCMRLGAPGVDVKTHSLEMQMWWRNHQRADANRKALREHLRNTSPLENVRRYNAKLNELEIAPNGGDYNALLDLLAGGKYRDPHKGGR